MDYKTTMYLTTQIGNLELELDGESLISLSIVENSFTSVKNEPLFTPSDGNKIMQAISFQLKQYFSSAIDFQNIVLAPRGTSFQKSVWHALTQIPKGETRTYGQIAKKLNSSARAVGNACRRNPIAIIIPCHRVISANGLGGYAGQTQGEQLMIKRWLLTHEGVNL